MKIFTVFVVLSTDLLQARSSSKKETTYYYQDVFIEKSYLGKMKSLKTNLFYIS